MKKILLVTMALIAALSPLAAQGFSIGPKASVGTSGCRGALYDDFLDDNNYKNKFNFAFSGGLTALYELSPMLGIQADILFARLGFKYGDDDYWESHNFNSINLPVYARFTFDLGDFSVYALAGVDLAFLFGDVKYKNSAGPSSSASVKDAYDTQFNFGIAVGAGVSLPLGSGTADIGLRYRTNLNKVVDDCKQFFQSLMLDFAYRFAL